MDQQYKISDYDEDLRSFILTNVLNCPDGYTNQAFDFAIDYLNECFKIPVDYS